MLKRRKTPLSVIFFILFLYFIFLPILAVNAVVEFGNPLVADSFTELMTQVITFIRDITSYVAILVIIVGAWYILAAGGDASKINTGKSIIIYALLALFIIVFINEITKIITGIFENEIENGMLED